MDYRDVLDARGKDWPTLNRTSLALAHQAARGQAWGLLLVWPHADDSDSSQRLYRLRAMVSAWRLEWIRMNAWFLPKCRRLPSGALGLFAYGISRRQIVRLAQDRLANFLALGDSAGRVHLISSDRTERRLGPFHPGLLAQTCSELREPDFTALAFDMPPRHWIEDRCARTYVREHAIPPLPPIPPRS